MKVTLSFEQSQSSDVSIMVDALRASSTITLALNNFKKVIPCFTPEEGFELKNKLGGILAGERGGAKIEGFDIGNSPSKLNEFNSDEDTLILTTSNGTRILENMSGKVLVGSMINGKSTGKISSKLASNHIDVVMAGVKGEFAIEDFLASGEILFWICKNLKNYELSEYAKAAILASRNTELVEKAFLNSKSGKRLIELGYKKDVDFCLQKNITNNVAIYKNKELILYKD